MAMSKPNATADLSLCLCTWNVCQSLPPDDYNLLFNLDSHTLPDIIVIGLQEMDLSLGAFLSDSVTDDWWTSSVTEVLSKKNYVRVQSIRLLGMLLLVFVLRPHVPYITNVRTQYTRTGFNGYWGNKGAVSVRLDIHGVNMCFVNCHFAAHDHAIVQRIMDHDHTVEQQKFLMPDGEYISILDHDYVFWLGDMNFRLENIDRDNAVAKLKQCQSLCDYSSLWKHDSLSRLLQEDVIFTDFEEGKLNFPCTYKYDKGTDNYDSSKKKRIPSWCDRILWLVHEDTFIGAKLSVVQHSYTSLQDYKISDHKPVTGNFTIKTLSRLEPKVSFATYDWDHSSDVTINYSVSTDLQVSSWDWIGLYKADYRHLGDYQMYTWVSTVCADTDQQGRRHYRAKIGYLSLMSFVGSYCLIYHSAKHKSLVGHSRPFQIR